MQRNFTLSIDATDRIQDFTDGTDLIRLPAGLSFTDLSFDRGFDPIQENGIVVGTREKTLILDRRTNLIVVELTGVSFAVLNSDDFLV